REPAEVAAERRPDARARGDMRIERELGVADHVDLVPPPAIVERGDHAMQDRAADRELAVDALHAEREVVREAIVGLRRDELGERVVADRGVDLPRLGARDTGRADERSENTRTSLDHAISSLDVASRSRGCRRARVRWRPDPRPRAAPRNASTPAVVISG